MSSTGEIDAAWQDPRLLEDLYRKAVQQGKAEQFAADVEQRYSAAPDSILLAAWHFRLHGEQGAPAQPAAPARRINWQLAAPLGLILGIVFWVLTDSSMVLPSSIPYLAFLWAPLAATAIIALVTFGALGQRPLWRSLVVVIFILALGIYAVWLEGAARSDYQAIAFIHLPLLAWIAVGLVVVGWGSDDQNRFAFLIKSVEAAITGVIYGGAASLFLGVTYGIFQAIGVTFSDSVMRLAMSLVAGLTPLLAVATVFDERFAAIDQRFDEGLSKLISTLGRFFLPLTLAVGVVYVITILFNFWKPFEERDVLIAYNGMLFAVMALLIFATPVSAARLSEDSLQVWLRRGIMAVAALTVLVSLYALSAILYRTAQGGITVNRLTVIGWNIINIVVLIYLLYRQAAVGQAQWLPALWRTARLGMVLYAAWALFLLLSIPWLFAA